MRGWFEELSLEHGTCSLRIHGPRRTEDLAEAWSFLPRSGVGWVALIDEVRRYEPDRPEGILLHAEVADGRRSVVLRREDGCWRAWTWEEADGDDCRVVRRLYASSAPRLTGAAPLMEYATYWQRVEDDGISVWAPRGSRFCGWKEQQE